MKLRAKIFILFAVAAFLPIVSVGTIVFVDWGLVENIDRAEAFARLRDLSDVAVIGGALALLIVFFLASFLSQSLLDGTGSLLVAIDEEKRRLAEAKAKYETLLQSIGDGVVAIDSDGAVIFMNQAAEDIFGLQPKEEIGKSFTTLIRLFDRHGRPIADKARPFARALAGERVVVPVTAPYYSVRGKTRVPVSIIATPVLLDAAVIGAIGVFRDVTKEFAVDKAKTEFLSLVSHQLRTPLSTINWYAEMLLHGDVGKLTEKQKKFLGEIYRGNQRMVDLIKALLNVSRIELSAFQVELEPMDVAELVERAVVNAALEAKQKRLRVTESYADLPKVPLDPHLMRMVLDNLLSNAINYTPEGGGIAVALERMPAAFRISVKDTGYGIPKAQQDKIFTKLFRADNVRKKDTLGTGLGLYIVKSILDAVCGKIWFESEENKGTTFFVELPMSGMKAKPSAG